MRFMNSSLFRARLLAFFLDLALCAFFADLLGLAATALIWLWAPGWRRAISWIWAAAAAAALFAFLLRDASGGRARRWLALEVTDPRGRAPGAWGSIRRNLPLVVPVWNLLEAWPVIRDGRAQRSADRKRGLRVVSTI